MSSATNINPVPATKATAMIMNTAVCTGILASDCSGTDASLPELAVLSDSSDIVMKHLLSDPQYPPLGDLRYSKQSYRSSHQKMLGIDNLQLHVVTGSNLLKPLKTPARHRDGAETVAHAIANSF